MTVPSKTHDIPDAAQLLAYRSSNKSKKPLSESAVMHKCCYVLSMALSVTFARGCQPQTAGPVRLHHYRNARKHAHAIAQAAPSVKLRVSRGLLEDEESAIRLMEAESAIALRDWKCIQEIIKVCCSCKYAARC